MQRRDVADATLIHIFLAAFSLILIITSLFCGELATLPARLWKIFSSPHSPSVDACFVGGLSGALLNSGLLGLIAVLLLALTRTRPGGLSIGAYFLTVGLGFFGKNCLNIWPIVLGVYLYARHEKQPFGDYVHYALFGAALAPIVCEFLFVNPLELPLPLCILLAVSIGALFGFMMPPLAQHTSTMHKDHNLYNAGLAAGLLGMLFFAVYKNAILAPLGLSYSPNTVEGVGFNTFFPIYFGALFLCCIVIGAVMPGSFASYKKLLRHTGYRCDFTREFGFGAVLINLGALGLMALAYMLCVGAHFTGPVIGSMLCLVCWGGLGSHPRNIFPIMLGYMLLRLVTGLPLNSSNWLIGICFATGLSPIAGRWGIGWGLLAGALHACLVLNTVAFHSGFNLYNGGFTAGLVAMILLPVHENTYFYLERWGWFKTRGGAAGSPPKPHGSENGLYSEL